MSGADTEPSHDFPCMIICPHTYRKWRQEKAEMLAKKDADEEAAFEELKAQARKELAEWYARHDDQLTQTKASNR